MLRLAKLALRLTARQFLQFLLIAAAGSGPLRLGSSLLAGRALYLLTFYLVFNLGGIRHCKFLIPQKISCRPARSNHSAAHVTSMLSAIAIETKVKPALDAPNLCAILDAWPQIHPPKCLP